MPRPPPPLAKESAASPLLTILLQSLKGTQYESHLQSLLALNPEISQASSEALFTAILETERSHAERDTLTNLLNITALEERMLGALASAKRNSNQLVLLTMGVSGFRDIRDTLGRKKGDEILLWVAKQLREIVRTEDILCRDQNEFVLCMTVKKVEDTDTIVSKLKETFSHSTPLDHEQTPVSLQIGASISPNDGDDVEELLKKSRTAMRRSPGECHYEFFSDDMQKGAKDRLQMVQDMRDGLEQNEFAVFYQPKIDLLTGNILGLEALVRWIPPGKGIISPALFIPAAEESGLIVDIGGFVLQEACTQLKKWHTMGFHNLQMAVNIASQQLRDDSIIKVVDTILQTTKFFPDRLELEITESSAMVNVEKTIALLVSLRQRGIQIAVDDFGTGYSSLSYLKRFPITTLKVDQSFVRDLPEDLDSLEIVNAIIAMGRSLGFKTVAEGVETSAQEAVLRTAGCHAVQGFLYGKPLPVEEITPLLGKSFRSPHPV